MTRALRPIFLTVLLAGMLLTLVMAPSALQAQQAPPGRGSVGYGEVAAAAPDARQISLGKISSGSSNAVWWVVAVLAAVLLVAAVVTIYLRRQS